MASFYKDVVSKAYVNTFYALCIALDNYLSTRLLNSDGSRIVYASTAYALRKRAGQNEWNNANLPFINYKMDEKTFGGKRPWFSMEAFSQGIYIDELKKKLRITPISISFDSTYWTSRDDDYQYATDMMIMDASAETKLKFTMDYGGILVDNIAIVDFNFDTSPQFTEEDWLTQNKIMSFSINPSIQTFLPLTNVEGYCIPKTVLLDFLVKKDIINQGEVIEYDQAMQFTIDHFNQTITEKVTI